MSKLYQGFAIIEEPLLGPSAVYYPANERQSYDKHFESRTLSDGTRILHQAWLDEPTDFNSIQRAAEKARKDYRE